MVIGSQAALERFVPAVALIHFEDPALGWPREWALAMGLLIGLATIIIGFRYGPALPGILFACLIAGAVALEVRGVLNVVLDESEANVDQVGFIRYQKDRWGRGSSCTLVVWKTPDSPQRQRLFIRGAPGVVQFNNVGLGELTWREGYFHMPYAVPNWRPLPWDASNCP